MKSYYVYIYLDPRKPGKYAYKMCTFLFEPFYVGKGTGNRLFRHLWKSCRKRDTNFLKCRKVQKIQSLGIDLKPYILKYATQLSHNQALLIESNLIANIGQLIKKSGPLTNILEKGGKTSSLQVHNLRVMRQKESWTAERKLHHSLIMKTLYHAPYSSLRKGLLTPHDNNGMQISLTRKQRFKTGKIPLPIGGKNSNSKVWIFISPSGKRFTVKGESKKFCSQHNLPEWTMRELAKQSGKYKKQDWNGWKCMFAMHNLVHK